jgi:hypothetical protein
VRAGAKLSAVDGGVTPDGGVGAGERHDGGAEVVAVRAVAGRSLGVATFVEPDGGVDPEPGVDAEPDGCVDPELGVDADPDGGVAEPDGGVEGESDEGVDGESAGAGDRHEGATDVVAARAVDGVVVLESEGVAGDRHDSGADVVAVRGAAGVSWRVGALDGDSVGTDVPDGVSAVGTDVPDGVSAVGTDVPDGVSAVGTDVPDGVSAVGTDVPDGGVGAGVRHEGGTDVVPVREIEYEVDETGGGSLVDDRDDDTAGSTPGDRGLESTARIAGSEPIACERSARMAGSEPMACERLVFDAGRMLGSEPAAIGVRDSAIDAPRDGGSDVDAARDGGSDAVRVPVAGVIARTPAGGVARDARGGAVTPLSMTRRACSTTCGSIVTATP